MLVMPTRAIRGKTTNIFMLTSLMTCPQNVGLYRFASRIASINL